MGSQAPSLRRLMSARRPIRSCAKPAHRRRRLWGLRRIAALSGFTGGSASDRRPEDLGHSRGIAISAWPVIMSGSPMSWRTTGGAPAQCQSLNTVRSAQAAIRPSGYDALVSSGSRDARHNRGVGMRNSGAG